eukprot:2752730-Pyramimonas_sp.AAC.1
MMLGTANLANSSNFEVASAPSAATSRISSICATASSAPPSSSEYVGDDSSASECAWPTCLADPLAQWAPQYMTEGSCSVRPRAGPAVRCRARNGAPALRRAL